MSERRTGAWELLRKPAVYEAVQRLFGARHGREFFVRNYLRPSPGDRVLDIGCGTARLARDLGRVKYVGFEPNPAYVEQGRQENRDLDVTLHAGLLDEAAARRLEPVDLVVVSAVLHHLDDGQARELFDLLALVTKPTARIATIDPVLVRGQNPVARMLVRMDRGRSVRTPDGYATLVTGGFGVVRGEVLERRWPPYTLWMMECSRTEPPAGAGGEPGSSVSPG
jgi:SAM-dependent methyltransferase